MCSALPLFVLYFSEIVQLVRLGDEIEEVKLCNSGSLLQPAHAFLVFEKVQSIIDPPPLPSSIYF
uniref:Uncharacterized protein n=1 Tax=Nelumbo nucifera TaxID=4432 RepID=A0A822Y6Z3_NELNU|nr:TPA_asm: hypothetical protein HUJ06_026842 [Nelumbo nucifera]